LGQKSVNRGIVLEADDEIDVTARKISGSGSGTVTDGDRIRPKSMNGITETTDYKEAEMFLFGSRRNPFYKIYEFSMKTKGSARVAVFKTIAPG
jgi:hypothetical protein